MQHFSNIHVYKAAEFQADRDVIIWAGHMYGIPSLSILYFISVCQQTGIFFAVVYLGCSYFIFCFNCSIHVFVSLNTNYHFCIGNLSDL